MTTEATVREAYWWEAEKKRSKRLDYCRKAYYPKGTQAGDFGEGVRFSLHKMYWMTKVFKETDGQPWVLRRAMALAETLENMPIYVQDYSLIVGYQSGRPNEMPVHPDATEWLLSDIFYDRRGYLYEEEREWYQKATDYWADKSMRAICDRYFSEEEIMGMTAVLGHVLEEYMSGVSACHYPHDLIFNHGVAGIMNLIEDQVEKAEDKLYDGSATLEIGEIIPKLDQWNAMKVALQAFSDWIKRYSRLARIIGENLEEDPKRKAELLRVADICAKVSVDPPEHFHEAVQLTHFLHTCIRYLERPNMGYGIRPDTEWWPYYKRDVIDEKTLTRQEAVELIGEWEIRCRELEYVCTRAEREGAQGGYSLPVVTIGGVDEDGKDACNDLTEDIMEASRLVRVDMPSIVFRYHPQARVSTLRGVFETVKQGLGFPSLHSEAALVNNLVANFPVTLEEARSYATVVCLSPGITRGKGGQGVRMQSAFVGTKPLMLTLFNGFDIGVGIQAGPQTGDASKFTSFEELWEAWRAQMKFWADQCCRVRNKYRAIESLYASKPLGSCMYSRSISSGRDCTCPDEPSNAWITVVAWGDVGDSMYAARKLVFEDKKYTMEQLVDALRANWEGYENMRMEFAAVPKWGNDIDEVDRVVADCFDVLADVISANTDMAGYPFRPLPENGSAFAVLAHRVSALPNGRCHGDPIYDGGNSPGAGCDKKGPTAVLRSCSKIDYMRQKNCLLNQRLSQTQMAGEKGFQLWLNYVKTWYDLGLPHVQFNCVDTETLRAAQREPEKYSELVVRVAGYSAYFPALNRVTQDSIIARTLQEV